MYICMNTFVSRLKTNCKYINIIFIYLAYKADILYIKYRNNCLFNIKPLARAGHMLKNLI